VGRDLAFVLQDFNKRNEGGEGTGERREEEGREGGKEKGWEGKGKDLPDQCKIASYAPAIIILLLHRTLHGGSPTHQQIGLHVRQAIGSAPGWQCSSYNEI